MLCKTGTPIISTGKKCTASKQRHFQCIPLANMPEKHLLRIVLPNFLRLSCLFHWCDSFGNCAWLSVIHRTIHGEHIAVYETETRISFNLSEKILYCP